jgi:alcohol-forming fatty acyl-CoA reductase
MFGTSHCVADLTPVDLPVNVLISVAWYTAVMKPRQVLVYNVTTGGVNPFTWGEMGQLVAVSLIQHEPFLFYDAVL